MPKAHDDQPAETSHRSRFARISSHAKTGLVGLSLSSGVALGEEAPMPRPSPQPIAKSYTAKPDGNDSDQQEMLNRAATLLNKVFTGVEAVLEAQKTSAAVQIGPRLNEAEPEGPGRYVNAIGSSREKAKQLAQSISPTAVQAEWPVLYAPKGQLTLRDRLAQVADESSPKLSSTELATIGELARYAYDEQASGKPLLDQTHPLTKQLASLALNSTGEDRQLGLWAAIEKNYRLYQESIQDLDKLSAGHNTSRMR